MKQTLKAIAEWFRFLVTGKSDKAVSDKLCDFSGQGRNRYGQ
jgi:hypothetical protein